MFNFYFLCHFWRSICSEYTKLNETLLYLIYNLKHLLFDCKIFNFDFKMLEINTEKNNSYVGLVQYPYKNTSNGFCYEFSSKSLFVEICDSNIRFLTFDSNMCIDELEVDTEFREIKKNDILRISINNKTKKCNLYKLNQDKTTSRNLLKYSKYAQFFYFLCSKCIRIRQREKI